MKPIILSVLVALTMSGCSTFKNSPDELIASKCRLKMPIVKEECERVGVSRTKGGQLKGLPVTNK